MTLTVRTLNPQATPSLLTPARWTLPGLRLARP
jgi:hypothetical protein